MASVITATSYTDRAIGPHRSWVKEVMICPARGISPREGARPTTLLLAVGLRIETPVSLPRPACANTAASAAPVPPLEPPGVNARL
jgi:hypothetical protein